MSITTAQATILLENVLFESQAAAQANASYWVGLSQSVAADATIAGAATAMAATPEIGIAEQVVRYYEGGLGRVPAGVEIAYYVAIAEGAMGPAQVAPGATAVPQAVWNQIATDFTQSPEFQFLNTTGSDLIHRLYTAVLGRNPTASDVAYYQNQQAAGLDASMLLQEFVNSPEYQNKVNSGLQQVLATYGAEVASGQVSVTPITLIGVAAPHAHVTG